MAHFCNHGFGERLYIKTLSAIAKIDRGLGNEVAEDSSKAVQNPHTDFQPVMRRTRKPGTGCITQINNHLFEGRYSPNAGRHTAGETP